MRQEIAGKTIDTLTAEELRAELRSAMEFFASGYLRPPAYARPEGGVQLSAAGAGIIAELYTVDVGMIFRLTRLFVTCNAATFGAPLANAGGIDVYRSSGGINESIDGTPFASLPQVATWSKSYAPTFRDGEIVRVGIVGGPANGQLYVRAAGFLEPLTDVGDTSRGN
jgi:hypothetical protein